LPGIPLVYAPQCSSNSMSDGSFLPLIEGYPVGLGAAILVGGYPSGLHTVMPLE